MDGYDFIGFFDRWCHDNIYQDEWPVAFDDEGFWCLDMPGYVEHMNMYDGHVLSAGKLM